MKSIITSESFTTTPLSPRMPMIAVALKGRFRNQVTHDHADQPERDDGHDDEGLGIGTQRYREQREDHEHGEREAAIQRVERLDLLLLFAAEKVREARVPGGESREELVGQDGVGFAGGKSRLRPRRP